LKTGVLLVVRMSTGRLFQVMGPATLKARSQLRMMIIEAELEGSHQSAHLRHPTRRYRREAAALTLS